MKRIVFATTLLSLSLMATDFTQMTTEELTAMRGTVPVEEREAFRTEMQSRLATMTAEQRAEFKATRQVTAQPLRDGSGAGQGQANMPTFTDFDADGDGKITAAELETARADRMAANAEEGKLLKNAADAPDFATLDSNSDGYLDETEFQAHQTAQMKSETNALGQGKQGANRGQGQVNRPTFADFDTDGDGKITAAELEAARADRMAANAEEGKLLKNAADAPDFATLDANSDGYLDETEFLAHQTTQIENRADTMGQGMRGQGQRLQDGSGAGSMMQGLHRGGKNQ